MERNTQPALGFKQYGLNFFIYAVIIIAVALVIFFVYKFIYEAQTTSNKVLLAGEVAAAADQSAKYDIAIPAITAGGEYTINFWIYLTSYGQYRATQRKHLVEINGPAFSTILIALAATTPTLLVRVHTDASGAALTGRAGIVYDCSEAELSSHINANGQLTANTNPNTIGSCRASVVKDNNLLTSRLHDNRLLSRDVSKFFESYNVEESLINADAACDVKDIALQKWVNICVVLNANVCETYLDGKLVKSCVYKHHYKVDNTGTTLRYLQGDPPGFDGYFAKLQVNNVALTPDDIYKTYLAGPTGKSPTNDPLSYIKFMFGA